MKAVAVQLVEVDGGDFANGAVTVAFAMTLRSLPELYKDIVGYELDGGPGGPAVQKGPLSRPVKGANNWGVQGYDVNDPCSTCEGSWFSQEANQVFGQNALSGFHDTMQISLGDGFWRQALNYPNMVPATVFTYSAFLGMPLTVMTPQQIILYSTSPAFNYDGRRR